MYKLIIFMPLIYKLAKIYNWRGRVGGGGRGEERRGRRGRWSRGRRRRIEIKIKTHCFNFSRFADGIVSYAPVQSMSHRDSPRRGIWACPQSGRSFRSSWISPGMAFHYITTVTTAGDTSCPGQRSRKMRYGKRRKWRKLTQTSRSFLSSKLYICWVLFILVFI